MRGCHDLNGRKNLNEKSGPWQDSVVANKDTEIGVKVGFVCEIFENSLEGEIPATAISGWRTANPKGELTTSIIQPSSQTEQLGLYFCGSQKWDSSWSCWITGLCREINLSGILSENDTVRCGEGWLFTRWPPSHQHLHILCTFVLLVRGQRAMSQPDGRWTLER